MGRRKKEPKCIHRSNIAAAASGLFMEKGMDAVSMDDIARASGYSKATLYVYFENKEEIVRMLVLNSMQKLYEYISSAIEQQAETEEKYRLICRGLVQYQEEFPFYFKMALDKIEIDFGECNCLPEEKEIYQVGERINGKLSEFLLDGMKAGALRRNLEIMPVVFSFWGMLSGFIQMASNKEQYIGKKMNMSKMQFLEYGFQLLYQSIAADTKEAEK